MLKRVLLIICLLCQLFALFLEYYPFGNLIWVMGMIFEIITGILYLVFFFTFFFRDNNFSTYLLLLNIPAFLYHALLIATTGNTVFIIASICCIVINIGLSIFGIIQKDKGKQFIYDKKILLILFLVSIIFIITGFILNYIYYAKWDTAILNDQPTDNLNILFYSTIILLGVFYIIISIRLVLIIKEYKHLIKLTK